jgi:hypothetical protein
MPNIDPDNYELKRDFAYPPSEKTILSYKRRINERWAKKGTSIKRAFTKYSIMFAVGLVALKCTYA